MKEETLNLVIELLEEIHKQKDYFDDDQPHLIEALEDVGIPEFELDATLRWLDDFSTKAKGGTLINQPQHNSVRIYSAEELRKIDVESRQFLSNLENLGIINTILREQIIDKVMSCEFNPVNITQTRWITYLVLANQEQEDDSPWLSDIIMLPQDSAQLAH